MIAPTGLGVSGRELRNGRLERVPSATRWSPLRGLRVSPTADGDALARAALTAVRRITAAAGKPLPAYVPPASYVAASPSSGGGLGGWLPIVLAVSSFLLAWLGYELWVSFRRKPVTPDERPSRAA